MEQGSWQRHGNNNLQIVVEGTSQTPAAARGLGGMVASFYSRRCTCRVLFGKALSTGFTAAQFAANITSVVLAVLRLSKQDYVDPADQSSSDHKSIKGSLNLFYGLVLVQGISNFLADTMLAVDVRQVLRLSETYQLGPSGVLTIKRYTLVTYMRCFSGYVREAMNMDLLSFAMELARSDSVADRLIGVRVLDRILRVDKYRELALMRIRASVETIGNMVNMLGLKNKTQKEVNTRGHAANVVLELSPDLIVESFPAMLQMQSSLITVKTTMVSSINQKYSSNVSMELTWFGVKILNKIMDNPKNCNKVAEAEGQVIASTVDHTAVSDADNSSISSPVVIEEIILEAVQVLHKLVSIAGDSGGVLRSKVSDNVHVLRNIRKILEYPRSDTKLLVEAIGVLACLALDETGREDIGCSLRIIRKLITFLVPRSTVISEIPADRTQLAKGTAEALVILAIDSDSIAWRILEELKPEDMQKLVEMLSVDSTELKTMVAKLLSILHANSNTEHAHHENKIGTTLPVLLKAIKSEVEKLEAPVSAGEHVDNFEEWRTKQGALLESFIKLIVQICTSIEARDFDAATRSANLTVHMVMQKLKKILDPYKSPAIEFPGIRRVTIELIIWMMQSSSHYIEVFFRYEMDKAMKELAETEERLEMFEMFYCGVGVVKHSESISSLFRSALDP